MITADMVAPIANAVQSGITTLVPVGIGIMATMLGFKIIPKVIYSFF